MIDEATTPSQVNDQEDDLPLNLPAAGLSPMDANSPEVRRIEILYNVETGQVALTQNCETLGMAVGIIANMLTHVSQEQHAKEVELAVIKEHLNANRRPVVDKPPRIIKPGDVGFGMRPNGIIH